MTIEAMKQALEALDIGLEYAESELYENRRRYEGYMHLAPDDQAYVNQIKEAITSLRQAIEQAEKQEPTEDMVLALRGASGLGTEDAIDALRDVLAVMPLYTTPQPQEFVCSTGLCHYKTAAQREWVGLTDDEIIKCTPTWGGTVEDVARAIEAKLKEKNT